MATLRRRAVSSKEAAQSKQQLRPSKLRRRPSERDSSDDRYGSVASTPVRHITASDIGFALLLFLCALPTRLYRVSYPGKIVFDEFHFSEFDNNYYAGKYFFDIHPPLGKLVLHAAGRVTGIQPAGEDFKFDRIGKQFADRLFVAHRVTSAIVGSMVPSTLFLTCRALDINLFPSLSAGVLSMSDILLLIESRLVLTDSQLIFYIQAALLCALQLWRTPKRTRSRYGWLLATSLFGGCSVSVKWTALVVPAMIALVSVTGSFFPLDGERLDLIEMIVAGSIALAIYVGSFSLHFRLLPRSGPGDAFMPCWFRSFLDGQTTCPSPSPDEARPSFFRSFVYLNKEMLRANSAIEVRHPWESGPVDWVRNSRGLLYFEERFGAGNVISEKIYLFVNPVLAPIVVCSLLACLLWSFRALDFILREGSRLVDGKLASDLKDESLVAEVEASLSRRRYLGIIFFFCSCYCLNILPYVAVKRCTFVYHYLPPLQHGIILSAAALHILVPERRGLQKIVSVIIMTAALLSLYIYRAWVYALPRTVDQHAALQLLPGWN